MKIPDKAIYPGVKVHIVDTLKTFSFESVRQVAGAFTTIKDVNYKGRWATVENVPGELRFSFDCFDAIDGVKYV